VGEGPARPDLENLAKQVYPQARFFGATYGSELETLFSAADLFVLPGTGGLAVQQAMSFGLPVIVAEADGTQADLVRPENGWSVPPGDLEALISAINQALEDVARLRRMGQASYRIVAEEINLENMLKAFEQAIQLVWEGV
jgi:glycosyltransferase involved in cell wall biosynthesis